MAQSPYRPFPTVVPQEPGHEYFRLNVTPEQFGAGIGRGLQEAGQGMEKAADIWGETQLNAQMNKALKEADQAVEDHLKLEGQAALADEPRVRARVQQIVDTYSQGLPTYLTNKYAERMRTYEERLWNGKITTHDVKQSKDLQNEIQADSYNLGLGMIAKNPWNENIFVTGFDTMAKARAVDLNNRGRTDPTIWKQETERVKAEAITARAEAMAAQGYPDKAMKFIDIPEIREALSVVIHPRTGGSFYSYLTNQFRTGMEKDQGRRQGEEFMQPIGPAGGTSAPMVPPPETRPKTMDDFAGRFNTSHPKDNPTQSYYEWLNPNKAAKPSSEKSDLSSAINMYRAEEPTEASRSSAIAAINRAVLGKPTEPSGHTFERADVASAAPAIRKIESGSAEGNYYDISRPSRDGDRAYGAYQVMGKNIPEWTQRWYGKRLNILEFLQNKEAQDKVFEGEFGSYVDKYGSPEMAARVWYGGPGGLQHLERTDVYGRYTVQGYGDRFRELYGAR